MSKTVQIVLSHWYNLSEELKESPQNFYKIVEEGIKRREVPNVSLSRVDYKEGGLFSAKREYLRATRKDLVFDICCAHFGTGFFVSWWLGQTPGFLARLFGMIPIIGGLFTRTFKPETYYQLDTALMFQESIHSAVSEVLDGMLKAKGIRSLSDSERKPILSDLFTR